MTELDVHVSPLEGCYGYPYLARIIGEDEVYRFARSFIRFRTEDFTDFTFYLRDGVYEGCIKYKDRKTNEVVKREPWWFLNVGGNFFDIERGEVLDAVKDFPAAVDELCGEGYWAEYQAARRRMYPEEYVDGTKS